MRPALDLEPTLNRAWLELVSKIRFVEGHDFSHAEKALIKSGLLAPEGFAGLLARTFLKQALVKRTQQSESSDAHVWAIKGSSPASDLRPPPAQCEGLRHNSKVAPNELRTGTGHDRTLVAGRVSVVFPSHVMKVTPSHVSAFEQQFHSRICLSFESISSSIACNSARRAVSLGAGKANSGGRPIPSS